MKSIKAFAAALLVACGGGGAATVAGPDIPGSTTPPPPTNPPAPPAPTPPPNTSAAPMTVTIHTLDRYFVETSVRIAAGGTVTFDIDDNWHDISFAPIPPGGNIVHVEEGQSVSRTFPTAGTYTFHCGRHGDGGTIHVEDSSTTSPPPAPTSPPAGPAATVTTPGVSFSPATVTIQAGQSVLWQISGARHNVTFRDAQPAGGNIPDTDAGQSVSRTFTTAGTYAYDCTRHSGMSGTIIVQ